MAELNTTLSATCCNICLQTAERPRMFDLSPLVLHPAKQEATVSDLCLNRLLQVILRPCIPSSTAKLAELWAMTGSGATPSQ